MRVPIATTTAWLGCLFAIAIGGACGDDNTPLDQFDPEISNLTDSFQLQATGLTGVTTTIDYAWQNTGTMADIDQSGVLTSGTARVIILDSSATQVYDGDLMTTGSYQSIAGTTGAWVIRLVTNNAQGDLNFRVQKP
ncbi:MAG: hypothetical protein ACR2QM_00770 [Longimicrobiales bacterium]